MTERQYPWDVLEIDETDDKKSIKKAYAALIKQYKPDENPEKFQETNEAFRFALHKARCVLFEIESKNNIENTNFNDNEYDLAKSLLLKVDELLTKKINHINNINNWGFIKEFENIYNIKLNYDISVSMYKKVAEFSLSKNKRVSVIDVDILNFLSISFHLNEYWREFEYEFPHEYITINNSTINLLEYLKNPIPITFSRLICFLLDYMIAIVLTVVVQKFAFLFLSIEFSSKTLLYMSFGFLFTYRICIESIILTHRSFGKIPRNLFILSVNGKFCSITKICIRNIIIFISITPLIFTNLEIKVETLPFVFLFMLIAIMNFLTNIFNGGFIHDLLTKSRVIKI